MIDLHAPRPDQDMHKMKAASVGQVRADDVSAASEKFMEKI